MTKDKLIGGTFVTSIDTSIFFNIYLFLREIETEHEWGKDRERRGDTESEAGSRL